jgi:hypothetical protein
MRRRDRRVRLSDWREDWRAGSHCEYHSWSACLGCAERSTGDLGCTHDQALTAHTLLWSCCCEDLIEDCSAVGRLQEGAEAEGRRGGGEEGRRGGGEEEGSSRERWEATARGYACAWPCMG